MKQICLGLFVSLAAQTVFAWGAYSNNRTCASKSIQAVVCYAAAQADGSITTLRDLKYNGREIPALSVMSDAASDRYAMASTLIAKTQDTKLESATFVLADETPVKASYVWLRTLNVDGTVTIIQQKLTCAEPQSGPLDWCGSN